MAVKLKKVASKILTKEAKHVREGTQTMLTHEHVISEATLTRE